MTLRKLFETYANVRPARELPGVPSAFSGRGIDLVIVRENVEDLYAGIEHMQTPGVAQCLKLITRSGCERISRLALEYARAEGRGEVAVVTKANIMKLTEGMFKRTFEEVAADYPDIRTRHVLVDNCAHQLVIRPEQFDVIVTSNMNGDILSDLASGLVGGLGFAPSANLGPNVAIFEAVHGTAPDIAGLDVANPTALLLAAVMLLDHIGASETAATVESALMATLEQGKHTRDVAGADGLGTKAFAAAVIDNLGVDSETARRPRRRLQVPGGPAVHVNATTSTIGVDVFVESRLSSDELGKQLEQAAAGTGFALKMISNRGTKVYPPSSTAPLCVDHWRARFISQSGVVADDEILVLLSAIGATHRWMHVEKLAQIDDVARLHARAGRELAPSRNRARVARLAPRVRYLPLEPVVDELLVVDCAQLELDVERGAFEGGDGEQLGRRGRGNRERMAARGDVARERRDAQRQAAHVERRLERRAIRRLNRVVAAVAAGADHPLERLAVLVHRCEQRACQLVGRGDDRLHVVGHRRERVARRGLPRDLRHERGGERGRACRRAARARRRIDGRDRRGEIGERQVSRGAHARSRAPGRAARQRGSATRAPRRPSPRDRPRP